MLSWKVGRDGGGGGEKQRGWGDLEDVCVEFGWAGQEGGGLSGC